jgi:hypothetical protein
MISTAGGEVDGEGSLEGGPGGLAPLGQGSGLVGIEPRYDGADADHLLVAEVAADVIHRFASASGVIERHGSRLFRGPGVEAGFQLVNPAPLAGGIGADQTAQTSHLIAQARGGSGGDAEIIAVAGQQIAALARLGVDHVAQDLVGERAHLAAVVDQGVVMRNALDHPARGRDAADQQQEGQGEQAHDRALGGAKLWQSAERHRDLRTASLSGARPGFSDRRRGRGRPAPVPGLEENGHVDRSDPVGGGLRPASAAAGG